MEQDKLIIEAGGKRVEVPLHLVKIELSKDWGEGGSGPEISIRAIATSKEETQKWGEIYGLVC